MRRPIGSDLTGALAALFLAAAPALAQQQPPPPEDRIPPAIVAVLDYQQVLRDSAAAKDIRRQIEGYRKTYQAEIAKEEEALRAEEAALKQQRALLSPEAFEDRRRQFERRVIEVQRQVQDRTRQLDQSFNQAMGELQAVLVPIVAEMTKTDRFNIVVEKSQVMFAATKLDITKRVIEQLDQKLTAVKVPKPQG
jgi:Skp family chaperone for outer membrane proteins